MAGNEERDLSAPPRWREVFQGRRGRLTAGLLLLEALVAIEALVVATIMPDVRQELGHIELYGLAFSSSALATFASIPIGGRAADRYGPRRVLAAMLGVLCLGLLIAGLAPSMPVLIVGRLFQGVAAGTLYSVSLGMVAKTYPERLRPRVLALLSSMWILPGLIGPPFGALVASTIGWRWAFVAPLPVLLVSWVLVMPTLREIPMAESNAGSIPVRAPIQLMIGAGLVLTGLTIVEVWAIPIVGAGLAIGIPALLAIVPRGTLRATPGLPAAAAAAFLLSFAFFAVDNFITLMLTGVRGLSLAEASIVVTLATVTWAMGSFWQSSKAQRIPASRLVFIGGVLVAIGTVLVAAGLVERVDALIPYVGWAAAGVGIGIAFPTIPLSVMREANVGEEAGELSATLLMDTLGVAIGAGLGGGSIAFARAFGRPLALGIGGAYLIGFVAILGLLLVSSRLPRASEPPG